MPPVSKQARQILEILARTIHNQIQTKLVHLVLKSQQPSLEIKAHTTATSGQSSFNWPARKMVPLSTNTEHPEDKVELE
jgi:hypothetical protein